MSTYKYFVLFTLCCVLFTLTSLSHVSTKIMAAVAAFRNHLTNNSQIPAAVVTQIIDVHAGVLPNSLEITNFERVSNFNSFLSNSKENSF